MKTQEPVATTQQRNRRPGLSKISDARETWDLNQSCARVTRQKVFTQPRPVGDIATGTSSCRAGGAPNVPLNPDGASKQSLAPLQVSKMPLAEPPPRDSRYGSPLKLSRVHWVRPEVVVEVTYLTWTEDNLLRQVSYQGQREDKPARQVVRSIPQKHLKEPKSRCADAAREQNGC